MPLLLCGCKITRITQPVSAELNSEITVQLTVVDELADSNAHKGLLGLLVPEDWQLLEATYSSSVGAGDLEASPAWTDSLIACYPPAGFEGAMKWIGLTSDKAYAYASPVTIQIQVRLQTGTAAGCFKLGYLVTKATSGMICSGQGSWAPFSYPNRIALPAGAVCPDDFGVKRSEAWDALLKRTSGWTGADGIYSIPLDGSEKPQGQDHLIIFSDTFLGEVNSSGRRINTTMVNNTIAWLQGTEPRADRIEFLWDKSNGANRSVFVPATPAAKPGEFYWLMDGIKIGELIHVFALRLSITGTGAFDWKLTGVAVLSFTLDADHYPAGVEQRDLPFFTENGQLSVALGQAIMPNTAASGSPHPDGYIYIYGPRDDAEGKSLIAARVQPDQFLDFAAWRFWDGSGWGSDPAACAGITNRLSQEFSVSPLGDRYILVCQIGAAVAIRLGDSPVGPFEFYNEIYQCPETAISNNILIYNAKAHPSLSNPDSLLISYNVNTVNFAENLNNADIYRPRFIKLATAGLLSSAASPAAEPGAAPGSFHLMQNYPNPFNPATAITFEVEKRTEVSLKIYNTRGELVEVLFAGQNFAPGRYTTRWQPHNLGSGLFFYTLEAPGWRETRKMMLIQ